MPLKLIALYGPNGSGVDEIVDKLCKRGYVLLPRNASNIEPEEVVARWEDTCQPRRKYVVRLKYVNEYIAATVLTFTCIYVRSRLTWMERFERLTKTGFPPSVTCWSEDEEDLKHYAPAKLFKIIL